MKCTIDMPSPLGKLFLVADNNCLVAIHFEDDPPVVAPCPDERTNRRLLDTAKLQLEEYFQGKRQQFKLPLEPQGGTAFQRAVWKILADIPYGETCTYRDIAQRMKNPNAVRAVGAANGANPLPIVVPCHRVIGSNGSLTGYAGGLDRKRTLLELEQQT